MRKKIYLVEDHPMMREMLGEAIDKMDGLAVCGTAASGEEALEQLAGAGADLVIIDLSLPSMSGIEVVERLRTQGPGDLPCIILSGHRESAYVQAALDAGANGYVLKGNPYELEDAIQYVLKGNGIYLSKPLQRT